MSIVKLNNRSVKDITAFGSISSLGSLTHIATQPASSSASLSFTSGIVSTYKEYIFYFVNIHPATDTANFTFQTSTNTGSSYGVTATTTFFAAIHTEDDSSASVAYYSSLDSAQSTSFIDLGGDTNNDNDGSLSGTMHLFNPSNTTFVKHFTARSSVYNHNPMSVDAFVSGYFNTTSAIDAVQFKFDSGNIDSGQILLFGLI